jgi:hypothetical protein
MGAEFEPSILRFTEEFAMQPHNISILGGKLQRRPTLIILRIVVDFANHPYNSIISI